MRRKYIVIVHDYISPLLRVYPAVTYIFLSFWQDVNCALPLLGFWWRLHQCVIYSFLYYYDAP